MLLCYSLCKEFNIVKVVFNVENVFLFSDCIEFVTDKCDMFLYNPAYSEELGLYLYSEDDLPIRYISLIKSKMFIYYTNGAIKCLEGMLRSVNVSDFTFNRRVKCGILGELLKYDYDSAVMYKLDVTKAFDYEERNLLIRKRSL